MERILITGGAGFVGSNLAVMLKELQPRRAITCLDNLKRRGSELTLPRLRQHGVQFRHGDIRCPEDLDHLPGFDVLLDCAAEPSVLAGTTGSPLQVLNPNLIGTIHCLEAARKHKAAFLLLSTSRVYPISAINALPFVEGETRYELVDQQTLPGASRAGIAEEFPLTGPRSLYGSSKLAAELLAQEYVFNYGLRAIILRCGILTGPWQMGKVDQGVVTFWLAQHLFHRELRYLGFGGSGKQVRDLLHVADLANLLDVQMRADESWDGSIYNVGGGRECSISLSELTEHCRQRTGHRIPITTVAETAPTDIRIYLTDSTRVQHKFSWKPKLNVDNILDDVYAWLLSHREDLRHIL